MKIKIDAKHQNIEGLLLALTPFFRNYRIPVIDINLSTIVFFVIIFIVLFDQIYLKKKGVLDFSKSVCFPTLFWMTIYLVLEYYIINVLRIGSFTIVRNFSALFLFLVELWGLFFCFSDDLLRRMFKKHITRITLIMCYVIFIQCFIYYLFGLALTKSFFVPFSSLCEPSVTEYINNSPLAVDGLFRPSAFFLEPSQFAAYSVLALGILIFKGGKKDKSKAVFITISIMLTTSGLGMAASLSLWGLKGVMLLGSGNKKKVLNTILIFYVGFAIIVVLYFVLVPFQSAVNRIIINNDQNAITGRLWTSVFLDQLSGVNKLLGVGFKNLPISDYSGSAYFMTSIVELLYCQGVLGTIVFAITMIGAIYNSVKEREVLSFSVLMIFIAWFIMGSILFPYHLINYIPFTYSEKTLDLKD